MEKLIFLIDSYSVFIFDYFLIISIFYIFLILISYNSLKEFIKVITNDITVTSDYTKPISIIVPAYNESEIIVDNIESLLNLNYPQFEIIVVNDGSKDNTLEKIITHFQLRKVDIDINNQLPSEKILAVYSSFKKSNLILVDKENGGKADALNAGINISRYPLFCGIDADCVVEKDALIKIVKPFLKHEETIAVGGIVRIANGCTIENGKILKAELPKKLILKFQIIEYFRAFLTSRVGWGRVNALLIISGAFGLFKKAAVVKVGGYHKTIGEDMELTLRLHEYHRKNKIPYKVNFTSDSVCWTQVPDSLKGLKTQRTRWHIGLIDSLMTHKKMLFNPKYGTVGLLSMPYYFFVEMLGPIFEIIGYIVMIIALITGVLSKYVLLIFLLAFLYGLLFSFSALLLEQFSYKRYQGVRNMTNLLLHCFLEQFFYRQLTVWWRVRAFIYFKRSNKQWGEIKRNSFSEKESKHETI